jgi:hypothetical protein
MAQTSIPFGVDIGVFFPTDSAVRSVYGSTWVRVGLSPLSFQHPEKWSFCFDIGILNRNKTNDDVLLIPVTVGFTRAFGQNVEARPYVAIRAGIYYVDVNSAAFAVDDTGYGFNANAAVGMTFNDKFYIEGRYDFYNDFQGIDFSGFSVSAGVRIFTIRL